MHEVAHQPLAASLIVLATCAGLVAIGARPATAIATATGPGRLNAPPPVGTVDTVAGPGFCSGPTVSDPRSAAVGGLAADAGGAGSLWFETGELGEGRVTKVFSSISATVQSTGAVPGAVPGGKGARPPAASAGRLAGDGRGGLLVAKPTAVLHLGDGLAPVAGTTSSASTAATPEAGSGDGGPLAAARFTHIAAIAADTTGNVYVAEVVDRPASTIAIRFLNRGAQPVSFYLGTAHQVTVAPGTVDTVVGRAGRGGRPRGPFSPLAATAPVLAVADGRLYVGTAVAGPRPRGEVRLVNLGGGELSAHGATLQPGEVAVVATVESRTRTTAAPAGVPRGGPLPGIAVDVQGNLFLADPIHHRVRRVDAKGVATTFAGTGIAGFNGNERAATTARLKYPYDVEIGPAGRVYISDAGNGQVRFVDAGGAIHAALGNGAGIRWSCRATGGSDATTAGAELGVRTGTPAGLAADASGSVYVALPGVGQVHRLSPSGRLEPAVGRPRGTACVDPSGCAPAEGSTAAAADLARPTGVALGPGGGLYVHDGPRVRLANLGRRPLRAHGVTVAPGALRTVVGRAGPPSAATGASPVPAVEAGPALEADATLTSALVADGQGNLLLADPRVGVRQVDDRGRISTLFAALFAALPPGETSTVDRSRCCAAPVGLAVDRAANLYVADGARVWFHNRGRTAVTAHGVRVAPGAIEAVAGSAGAGGEDGTGSALEASLAGAASVAVDRAGNLYVVTAADHSVQRVDRAGAITTVLGSGQRGFNGDGLRGALTALDRPSHAAVDACGNLLVTDANNDRVRRLGLAPACPATAPAAPAAERRTLGTLAAAGATVLAAGVLAAAALAARRARRGAR